MSTKQHYQDHGFCIERDLLDEADLAVVERTISKLILSAARRLSEDDQAEFTEQGYTEQGYTEQGYTEQGYEGRQLLHEGLLWLYKRDEDIVKHVFDGLYNSFALHKLITSPEIIDRAAVLSGCADQDELNIQHIYSRIDLPSRFSENTKMISLPYHQECAYYYENVSVDSGLVVWVPLFDCGENEGSLNVRVGSHRLKAIEHEKVVMDPANNRFVRMCVPQAVIERYPSESLDVRRGDVVFQSFYTLHASGQNIAENNVRYTMIGRFSRLVAPDFQPASLKFGRTESESAAASR